MSSRRFHEYSSEAYVKYKDIARQTIPINSGNPTLLYMLTR